MNTEGSPESAKSSWHRRRILAAALVLLVALMALALVALNILPSLLVALSPDVWQLKRSDVIIVLGTPATKDGKAGAVMSERVDRGVELLQHGYASHIIFTGAAAHNRFVEARVMAQRALSEGVSPQSIEVEEQARNTCQNAYFSVLVMNQHDWKSAIVVTSQAHLRRAGYIFSHFPISFCLAGCRNPPTQPALKVAQFDQLEKLNLLRMVFSGRAFYVDLTPQQREAAEHMQAKAITGSAK